MPWGSTNIEVVQTEFRQTVIESWFYELREMLTR